MSWMMAGTPYSEKFKKEMVGKLIGPGARSALALSAEVGVHQSTLSRWLREAGKVPATLSEKKTPPSPAIVASSRKERGPKEKIPVVGPEHDPA